MPTAAHDRIRPPPRWLAWSEGARALHDLSLLPLAAPMLGRCPRGDGHPVLVLPGFVTSDKSTEILRRFLCDLGYDACGWELGRNLGMRAIGARGEKLAARLAQVHEETGRKVSLVGWSLGGVMARELSRETPESIRQVISLGSPFTGNPRASTVTRLYEQLTGEDLDSLRLQERLEASRKPPPVPSTAIYTKLDGVVAWRNCVEPASDHTDNIEVVASHCGLGVHPAVLYAVADRLAQPEGQWSPFQRTGWRAAVYPSSGHLH